MTTTTIQTAKQRAQELGIPKDFARQFGDLRQKRTWEQALTEWTIVNPRTATTQQPDTDNSSCDVDEVLSTFIETLESVASNLGVENWRLDEYADCNRPYQLAAAINDYVRSWACESPNETISDVIERTEFISFALSELDRVKELESAPSAKDRGAH